MSLKILDKFNFINSHTKKGEESFLGWIASHKPSSTNDTVHPELLDKYLDDIYRCIDLFGEEIGYNFSLRLPKYNEIHLLSDENYDLFIKEKYPNRIFVSRGNTINWFKDIHVRFNSNDSIFGTLHAILHELVHQLSANNVYINPETLEFSVGSGYNIPHISSNLEFNEAMTEKITQYIIDKYWSKTPSINKIFPESRVIPYKSTIKEIDKEIQKIRDKNGYDCISIFLDLARGYFEGKQDFIFKYQSENILRVK